jgi:hypothetical protein
MHKLRVSDKSVPTTNEVGREGNFIICAFRQILLRFQASEMGVSCDTIRRSEGIM